VAAFLLSRPQICRCLLHLLWLQQLLARQRLLLLLLLQLLLLLHQA
jgi:hypothetical protein